MTWDDEIAGSHEVEVVVPAPGREPVRVPIWVVAVGGELYVRSWKGEAGVWYKRAKRHGVGTIGQRPVRFTPIAEPELDAAIDEAFRAKYGSSEYTEAMISPPAAGTTMRLDEA